MSHDNSEFFRSFSSHFTASCFVVDFDGTLTKYFDHAGKARPSIISLLYNEGILDEDYSLQAQKMYDYYVKKEHDDAISFHGRENLMKEWRTKHKELLIEKGLTLKHIAHITSMNAIQKREGIDTLFSFSQTHNIPLIIFSASGIGVDSISSLLTHWGLLLPHVHIISNRLYRNNQGVMIGYDKNVIHSLNKKESIIHQTPVYREVSEIIATKTVYIVMGDGLADAGMVDALPGRSILKVGLCHESDTSRLKKFMQAFDIVITEDDSLQDLMHMFTTAVSTQHI